MCEVASWGWFKKVFRQINNLLNKSYIYVVKNAKNGMIRVFTHKFRDLNVFLSPWVFIGILINCFFFETNALKCYINFFSTLYAKICANNDMIEQHFKTHKLSISVACINLFSFLDHNFISLFNRSIFLKKRSKFKGEKCLSMTIPIDSQ